MNTDLPNILVINPDEVHFSRMVSEAGYETLLFGIQHETPDPETRLRYDRIHPTQAAEKMAAFTHL